MILSKIVRFLTGFDARLKAVEDLQTEMAEAISQVRNSVSTPDGFIVTSGRAKPQNVEELKETLKFPIQMQLEEATIDLQFSQAFYLTASPNLKEKLHEFLSENELATLLESVRIYKEAERILGDAEQRAREIEEHYEQAKKDLDGSIERQAAHTFSRVVDRMNLQLTNLQRKQDYVEDAEHKLKSALDKVEQTVAKASNKLKLHQTNRSRISTP